MRLDSSNMLLYYTYLCFYSGVMHYISYRMLFFGIDNSLLRNTFVTFSCWQVKMGRAYHWKGSKGTTHGAHAVILPL